MKITNPTVQAARQSQMRSQAELSNSVLKEIKEEISCWQRTQTRQQNKEGDARFERGVQ